MNFKYKCCLLIVFIVIILLPGCKDKIIEYNVVFDSNGGAEVDTQLVKENGRITPPQDPIFEGHTFIGWFYGKTEWNFKDDFVNDNITLTAQWEINCYTLTIIIDDEITNKDYKYGEEIEEIETPVKDGYTFKGWNKELPKTMPSNDITLIAQWEINIYKVYYHDSHGHLIKSEDVEYGTIYTIKEYLFDEFTECLSWSDAPSINGVVIDSKLFNVGDEFFYDISGYLNLYAAKIKLNNQYILEYRSFSDLNITKYIGVEDTIIIPNSININNENFNTTFIEKDAFKDCVNLKEVDASNSIPLFGAFNGCYNIEKLLMRDSFDITRFAEVFGNEEFSNSYEVAHYDLTKNIEKLYLPDKLTSVIIFTSNKVDAGYFANCINIENIEIKFDDDLLVFDEVYEYTFYNCKQLKTLVIPQNIIKIYNNAFQKCESLNLDISNFSNLNEIWNYAFSGCISIGKIEFPSNLRYVSKFAFENCFALNEINFSNVEKCELSFAAFSGCENIKNLHITENVKLYEGALSGLSNLESITINNLFLYNYGHGTYECYPFGYYFGDKEYNNGMETVQGEYIYYMPKSLTTITLINLELIPNYMFENCVYLENIILDGYFDKTGGWAFKNCTNLINVSLPHTLSIYSGYSFADCHNLITVNTGFNVSSVGYNAFQNCYKLANLNTKNIISIDDYGFQNCYELVIEKLDQLEFVGDYAFQNCYNLKTCHFSESFRNYPLGQELELGIYAFENCVLLNEVIMPNVWSISEGVFRGCTNLASFEFSSDLVFIRSKAFYNSGIIDIKFKHEDIYIDDSAFENCLNLENVEIEKGKENQLFYNSRFIGCKAFANCPNLESVILRGTDEIREFAFYNCVSLTEFIIPNSVDYIGNGVFSGCYKLERITIPFIGDCRHNLDDANQYSFGYIFGEEEYINSYEASQVYLGDNSLSIIEKKYYIPVNLKIITITDMEYIPFGAFSHCNQIEKINIKCDILSIEQYSFGQCHSLKNINIPDTVNSIGMVAFFDCKELTEIYISENINSIDYGAFENCTKLNIYCEIKSQPINWNTNWNISNCRVYWDYGKNN